MDEVDRVIIDLFEKDKIIPIDGKWAIFRRSH